MADNAVQAAPAGFANERQQYDEPETSNNIAQTAAEQQQPQPAGSAAATATTATATTATAATAEQPGTSTSAVVYAQAVAAPQPFVRDCWEEAFDANSQRPYWFNRATGVSSWLAPDGPVAGAAAQPAATSAQQQQQQQQQEPPSPGSYEAGYYYRDVGGQLQGPFTYEQLRAWRDALPMNLLIQQLVKPAPPAGQQAAADGQQAASGGQQAGAASWWEAPRDLAVLLGDEALLEHWRLHNPYQAAWPNPAPPAGVYEAQQRSGTAAWLAEAVLAGLPADDMTVHLSRVAAAQGLGLQEVAEWSRQRSDYTATAYRVAARGRISTGVGQESLYAEATSWLNPADLEQQLAACAAQRKRQLSSEEIKTIRERKAQQKRQKQMGWLCT